MPKYCCILPYAVWMLTHPTEERWELSSLTFSLPPGFDLAFGKQPETITNLLGTLGRP